jgi:hypothetical protein
MYHLVNSGKSDESNWQDDQKGISGYYHPVFTVIVPEIALSFIEGRCFKFSGLPDSLAGSDQE